MSKSDLRVIFQVLLLCVMGFSLLITLVGAADVRPTSAITLTVALAGMAASLAGDTPPARPDSLDRPPAGGGASR